MKFNFVINIIKKASENKIHMFSTNFSYLIPLSLVPTINLSIKILGLIYRFFPFLPSFFFNDIKDILSILSFGTAANLIFYLVSLNLLSKGFYTLLSDNEEIFNIRKKSFFYKKAYAIFLSLLFVILLLFSVSLVFFLLDYYLLGKFSFLITYFFLFIMLLFFYHLTSFISYKKLYLGSLITSFLISLLTRLYSIYLASFSNSETTYGVLAPIIISLIYLYYISYIVYIGIIINSELLKYGNIRKNKLLKIQ